MSNGNKLYLKALKEAEKDDADLEVAFGFLSKSAKLNNNEALYAIGTWYLLGTHVKKDWSTAVEYLTRAAELGNPIALYDLAVCYEKARVLRKTLERHLNAI